MSTDPEMAPRSALTPIDRVLRGLSSIGSRVVSSTQGHRSFLLVAVGLLLIILYLFFSVYWSLAPGTFNPVEEAYAQAGPAEFADDGTPVPSGYITVNTLIRIVETLLDKPGGYLRNDRLPPGVFMDNMPSWEFGVLLEARTFSSALREGFSRTQTQSMEQPSLIEAEARLSFDPNAWLVPSPESQFREGADFLRVYRNVLVEQGLDSVAFTARQDKLADYLSRVEKRLGSLTIRLRANAGTYAYNPHLMQSAADRQGADAMDGPTTSETTAWNQVDNVFYEARGSAWALYHLLKSLRYDFRGVLDQQMALGHMNRAMSELHAAIQPMRSPIVLNGKEFSLLPNHSLTLSAYLAKAHLAVVELRRILTQPM